MKARAKQLLAHLHDKLVLDWRRKAATMADVRTTIRVMLDAGLPADPYPPEIFDAKVQAVFDHVITAYGDDGSSVYRGDEVEPAAHPGGVMTAPTDLGAIVDDVVERIRVDAEFAALVAEQLGMAGAAPLRIVAELIDNDEDVAVEFKSTARWYLRESQSSKAMEDAVVKTVAGFLNADGGTLLIGVGPDRSVIGLDHDYPRVKPPNGDGFVNWLNHRPHQRPRPRPRHALPGAGGRTQGEICRLDVARSSRPVWAKTSKAQRVFFVRMNNSTRELPDDEQETYLADRWPT